MSEEGRGEGRGGMEEERGWRRRGDGGGEGMEEQKEGGRKREERGEDQR